MPHSSSVRDEIQVLLDGCPVHIPAGRRSIAAIRSYLETISLEQHRILCALRIDGEQVNLAEQFLTQKSFRQVTGETIHLDQMPMQLIETAIQQAADAREQVISAVALVLINDGCLAREFWWNLARQLKNPLLTLNLVPEAICAPANGSAPATQLRKWQFEQLAAVLKDVDERCWSEDSNLLADALENRVMPWLDALLRSLYLMRDTLRRATR